MVAELLLLDVVAEHLILDVDAELLHLDVVAEVLQWHRVEIVVGYVDGQLLVDVVQHGLNKKYKKK